MAKRYLVFQHTSWEGPGRFFSECACKLNLDLNVVKLWKEPVPSLAPYDALIVLGGSPNVDQESTYPFLAKEKEAIKRSLSQDRPYLGICLGHQLLAEALGAKIGSNYCASIGFIDGHLTEAGRNHPLFKKLPPRLPLFKWHSQAIQPPLPRNMVVLATSTECQFEAVSVAGRPHIVGIQFDNNAADCKDVATYLERDRPWLTTQNGKYINPETVLSDAKKLQKSIARNFYRLLSNFIRCT